jgi:hypothetical protein
VRPITFPYTLYKGRWDPIIPIHLQGPRGWVPIWGYVDSGASFSILSVQSADRLGLQMSRGLRTNVVVGDGGLIPVYIHRLPIRIGTVDLRARVGFSPRLGVGFDLPRKTVSSSSR